MNQNTRTIVFLAAAGVSVGLAVLTGWANRPNDTAGGYELGTPFFPEFKDPLAATSLQVVTFDKDAARKNVFNVEKKNGIWQIPSHHNYPADGEERLAKTATSMLGVERGALVSTSKDDQKRYRVLDPMDDSVTGTEGRGDRITLKEGDKTLLDLIVGDRVEGQDGIYYVRRPDEKQIYRARLGSVDLSTKFADWIKQDVLEIHSSDLVEMRIDPYHIDEVQGLKIQDEAPILLERKPPSTAWTLDGIDKSMEKEKVSVINAMSRALADLKIIGVRRKPESLVALFTGEGEARLTRAEQFQMQSAGFFVIPPGQFLANEGEVQAGTKEGVLYRLQFGEVFTGSDVDIEVGKPAEEAEEAAESTESAEEGAESAEDSDKDQSDDSQKRSRYLFVSCVFDESLIGERPEAPVAPTPPAESDAGNATEEKPKEGTGDNSAGDAGTQCADGDDNGAAADAQETTDQPHTPTPQELYEQQQAEYETKLAAYEDELKKYEDKVKAGEEKVEKLNRRFAEWYYVISADLYENLKVSRADLVEPVKAEEKETGSTGEIPGPALTPPTAPSGSQPPAADAAPAPADSPADAPKSEAAPAPTSNDSESSDSTPKKPEAADPGASSSELDAADSGESAADADTGTEETP